MASPARLDPLDLVMRRGIRVSRPGFTVYAKRLTESYRPRIVVSGKLDKRATVRNRLRRQIRSILVPYLGDTIGIVIVCRPEILTMTFSELKPRLIAALETFPWKRS